MFTILEGMRPRQWLKNLFVFAGLLFTLDVDHPASDFLRVGLAFGLFCMLSGSIYLLNDILDAERDLPEEIHHGAQIVVVAGAVLLQDAPTGGGDVRLEAVGVTAGLLTGGLFVVGALVVRRIDALAEPVARVLAFANQGTLPLVVAITLVNGVAEELFFRGALYTALGRTRPVLISTVLYVIATSASGNPMLGFAAVILGTVCALERRATGGVLAPVLTHLVWGAIMVLALPPLFGL